MSFCHNCGSQLTKNSRFCDNCGAGVAVINQRVSVPQEIVNYDADFLVLTLRLIRWERKALSIYGKFLLISGIIFSVLFLLISLSTASDGKAYLSGLFFGYAVAYGFSYVLLGIINLVAANKTVRYIDGILSDASPSFTRCSSVGMIVFLVFFNQIALIFYCINFSRIKNCRHTVESIIQKQRMYENNHF